MSDARETFGDEFLIRTVSGYELTARARRLREELQSVLPEVDRMLRGDVFNPATAEDIFRVCASDSASMLIASRLPRRLNAIAPNTQLLLVAWHDKVYEDVTHGRIDVLLWANQVPAPRLFRELLQDDIVCVICKKHPIGDRPDDAKAVLRLPACIADVARPLAIGRGRGVGQVPAAAPRRPTRALLWGGGAGSRRYRPDRYHAAQTRRNPRGRSTRSHRAAPFNVARVRFLMAWHPSTNTEPALIWFREQLADVFTKL